MAIKTWRKARAAQVQPKRMSVESADMERLRHDGWRKTTGQTVEESADEHERPCSTARKNQCSLDKVME